MADPCDEGRAEIFLRVYSENQHRLSAFVHTLVPNWSDAEELLQDTALILWKKFDTFDTESDFFRWAAKIAQFELLNYRRRKSRDKLRLDNQAVDKLAVTAQEMSADMEFRREALAACLHRLSQRDSDIVKMRYRPGGDVQTIAEALGRSKSAIHKRLQRIRIQLLRCVRLRMSTYHWE